MESNVDERLKILDEMETFVEQTEKEMLFILQSLGWNNKRTTNNVSLRIPCPIDSSHLVGPHKMDQHVKICTMKHHQFNKEDELLPENANQHPFNTVIIDQDLCASIIREASKQNQHFKKGIAANKADNRPVPISRNQMMTLYTPDERKALYDYVISNTPASQNIFENFTLNSKREEKDDDGTSHLRELAMLRDMKRRRAKYKVSTKAKSHTEVMREVIGNLMMAHEEDVRVKIKDEIRHKDRKDRTEHHDRKHSHKRKHSRERNSESKSHKKHSKHKKHRKERDQIKYHS